MNQEFDIFNQPEINSIFLCKTNMEKLASIEKIIYDKELTLRFNSVSTFVFKIPKYRDYTKEDIMCIINNVDIPVYSLFESKRLILIDNIGYFIITGTKETDDGSTPILTVECSSLESELMNKKMVVFQAGKVPVDITSLIAILQKDYIPNWSFIGVVPPGLLVGTDNVAIMRSFDIADSNVYSFLINDFEKAFNAIVIFDRFSRSFYIETATSSDRKTTNIFLSHDNLIKTSELNEYSDEIVTAMYCYGGNNLDIRKVNPLGGDVIYNFDYYKTTEWMTSTMINKLTSWETAINNEELNVVDILTHYNNIPTYCKNVAEYLYALSKRNDEIKIQTTLRDKEVIDKTKAYYIANINFLTTGGTLPNNPSKYKLSIDNLYKWSYYGSLSSINNKITPFQNNINSIQSSIFTNKELKYSTKIKKLIDAYVVLEHYSSILLLRKSEYSSQEELMKNALNDKTDTSNFKANMAFLKNPINGANTHLPTDVPNTSLVKQNLIDSEYFTGTKSDDKKTIVTEALGSITNLEILITGINKLISEITIMLKNVNNYLNLRNYLGETDYNTLMPLIIENTYKNENILVTDIMTNDVVIEQSTSLYNQSKDILLKSSQPRYEFSIQLSNFINLIEYKDTFTKELELGKQITLEISDTIIQPILLEITYMLDKPEEITLTFGNKLRLDNQRFQYTDLINELTNTSSDVSSNKIMWDNWNSYRDDVTNFINSSLNASKNSVINSTNEDITISAQGIRGRKRLLDGGYSPEEIWISNNQIGFTKDAWDTTSLAFGKVPIYDPNNPSIITNYGYGIIGDAVVGNLIAGKNLIIKNLNGSFVADENGVNITNMDINLLSNNGANRIIINPTDGLKIQKKIESSAEYTDIFSFVGGSLKVKGNAKIGGTWVVNDKGLIYQNGTIINKIYPDEISFANGAFKVTSTEVQMGTVDKSGAMINGIKVTSTGAASFFGNVGNNIKFTNLSTNILNAEAYSVGAAGAGTEYGISVTFLNNGVGDTNTRRITCTGGIITDILE